MPPEPRGDIEPPSTAAMAPPAAGVLTEGRRAQMRCQMVQTEGATLAESRRAHAAFMTAASDSLAICRVVREGACLTRLWP